jgi:predicted aspartyl protease
MPILNIQLAGEAQTPDGKTVPIPPQVALVQRGPVVQVSVSVGQIIAQQILQQGGTLPPPVSGLALIDTGATTTCIDEEAARQLSLPAIDVVTVASASHAATEQNVYPISIEVVGLPIVVNASRAIGAALKAQGLLVLIGRDVLQSCVLIYNGPSGHFTLTL